MSVSRRVLVAVDASEASHRAVEYVAELLGGRPGFHVGLVHLELPPRMLEWGGSDDPEIERAVSAERAAAYQELKKEAVESGQDLLQKLHAVLSAKGIDVTARLVRFEEPLNRKNIADDLLSLAKEREYGTIVVGRHSFSGLKRLFEHHVGEELVRTGIGVTIWIVE